MYNSIDFKNSVLWMHFAKDFWYDYNNGIKTTYVFGATIKQSDKYKAYYLYLFNFKLAYLILK